jgi:hypothetical protein
MHRVLIAFTLLFMNIGGILSAQTGADPSQRYFRIICLVHLTGSGAAGDPIVPEYVVQGVATAQAGLQAAAAASSAAAANAPLPGAAMRPVARPATTTPTTTTFPAAPGTAPPPGPMSSRPGILGWSMQKSDDGTMAIVQMVAADHHTFDSILADTRPEILVFEIGKTDPATIQAALQKYKQDFNLVNFRVMVR